MQRLETERLPHVAEHYECEKTRRLVGLCFILATLNGGCNFFLSSHAVAVRFGLKPMQAYRLLSMLVDDGVLGKTETGNSYRANRYRWKGS
jgi:hypothetical protein